MKSPKSEADSELDLFERFAWPVPLSFASAVFATRFEQGDVLYCDARAYSPLAEADLAGIRAIQILEPKRSARSAPAEVDRDRRQSSWDSPVTIELVDLGGDTPPERREITQGQLVMALWQGSEDWLDADSEPPPLPRTGRDLLSVLGETSAHFDEAAAEVDGVGGSRFVFVVDHSSDASRAKARSVEEALAATGAVVRLDRSPAEAGVDEGVLFHPALSVRCLVTPGRDPDAVLPILRSRLYGGSVGVSEATEGSEGSAESDTEAPADSPKDRFAIGRHGLLETVGAEPTEPGSSPS